MKFPNIEAERARSGMTKSELAKKLGVTADTLKNWQNGRTEVPVSKLVSLADLFGVTTDYLLSRGGSVYKREFIKRVEKAKITGSTIVGNCPFCKEDRSHSFVGNIETGEWYCFKEKIGGSFDDFADRAGGTNQNDLHLQALREGV